MNSAINGSGEAAHHHTAKLWRQTLATLRGRERLAVIRGERLAQRIAGIISAPDGDPAGKARAIELGMDYLEMDDPAKLLFFHTLAAEFDADREAVEAAGRRLAAAAEPEERVTAELELRGAAASARGTFPPAQSASGRLPLSHQHARRPAASHANRCRPAKAR